jgi:hypothetical protein
MNALLGSSLALGCCEECGLGKCPPVAFRTIDATWPVTVSVEIKLFRITFRSGGTLVLCVGCYRKLSDMLVYEFEYGMGLQTVMQETTEKWSAER